MALATPPTPHRVRARTRHTGGHARGAAHELGSTTPSTAAAAEDAFVPNEDHVTAMALVATTAEGGGGGGATSSPGAAAASGASGSDAARARAGVPPAGLVDAARARNSFVTVSQLDV